MRGCARPAALGAHVDLPEGYLGLGTEGLRVLLQPGRELHFRGRGGRRRVLDQELELLAQAPPDDRVVAVEAHPHRFPGGDLLLDVVVDQPLELGVARGPLPGAGEARGQVLDEAGGLWIDDQSFPAERFEEGLRAAAGDDPDPKVVIRGDARLRLGEVRQAMLAIEQAGFHGVGLIAKRAGDKAQGD